MRALLVVAVAVMGCGLPGSPVVGSPCTADDQPECMTATSLGICNISKWHEQKCDGRCSNEQSPKCAYAAPTVGDPCPAVLTNKVACSSDPDVLAKCRGDAGTAPVWTACACTGCDTSTGIVQCGNRLACD